MSGTPRAPRPAPPSSAQFLFNPIGQGDIRAATAKVGGTTRRIDDPRTARRMNRRSFNAAKVAAILTPYPRLTLPEPALPARHGYQIAAIDSGLFTARPSAASCPYFSDFGLCAVSASDPFRPPSATEVGRCASWRPSGARRCCVSVPQGLRACAAVVGGQRGSDTAQVFLRRIRV